MNKLGILFAFELLIIISCSKKTITPSDNIPTTPDTLVIRGADLSFLSEIEQAGTFFYDKNGVKKDALTILKENGCNTVRVRLWHTPSTSHSSLSEVIVFAKRIKAAGLKVWLDFHYSDTWADPGNQLTPAAWQSLNLNTLQDSVYNYTARVMSIIQPEYVQIGNEINGGFLWDTGRITNSAKFISLLKKGCTAVRSSSPSAKIIIHYAGLNNASSFYDLLRNNSMDYDIIGLSYYPVFHGLSLSNVKTTIDGLTTANNKSILIAETAYPFTLGYNDFTNNIVGLPTQLISGYPASADGQKNYLLALRKIIQDNSKGLGFCYWGTEWVAFKGTTATDGSSFENQALFDFTNKALPAMEVFNK